MQNPGICREMKFAAQPVLGGEIHSWSSKLINV